MTLSNIIMYEANVQKTKAIDSIGRNNFQHSSIKSKKKEITDRFTAV